MRKPKSIEDLVKGVIKELSKKGRLSAEEIAAVWASAVGDAAAKHTKPIAFRRSDLVVHVDDSGWLYELSTKKRDILKKLEGKLKNRKLKNIRFRIGEIK